MELNLILYGCLFIQVLKSIFDIFIFRKIENRYLALTSVFSFLFVTLVLFPDLGSYLQQFGLPFTYKIRNGFLFFAMGSYYSFVFYLLDNPDKHVVFGKIVKFFSTFLCFAGVLYIVHDLIGANWFWVFYFSATIYFLNCFMQGYTIYYLFKTKLPRIIPIAYATLLVFVVSKFFFVPGFQINDFGIHLFPKSYLILIVLNLYLFIFSTSMVNGMWKNIKGLTKIEFQKALELNEQRIEISNDLHDDLGATLSSLHIYSSIAYEHVDVNPVKARANLAHISRNVLTLMEKINDAIWSVSTNDSNVSLLSTRIKDCFVNIFDAADIKCTYEIDENIELALTGLKARKFLLLFAKEAINNAIKHSSATSIRFSIKKIDDNLLMAIEDNGKGIEDLDFTKGNGLSNLKYRADQLNGHFSIETLKPKGTLVECLIPLTNISL